MSLVPKLAEFKPLPHQREVIKAIRKKYDYSLGVHEVTLSGAVGSAKTIVGAHIGLTHALLYPNSHVGVGRISQQLLKDTLWDTILKHARDGIQYSYNGSSMQMRFPNGSMISGHFWGDKNYMKFRSQAFSMFIAEELTENETLEFYDEMELRVGRMSHVEEKLILNLTNPDDPSHPAYKRLIRTNSPTKHVYYSKTADNPYLPTSYINQLKEKLSPRMARRMLYGEWLSISKDVIYYAYDRDYNYREESYVVDKRYPIHICWDFNIGNGKPLSLCAFQYKEGKIHVFAEVVVHGTRTLDSCDELKERGILDHETRYVLQGDSTGRHRDTRNKHSDWDIIDDFFRGYFNKKGTRIIYKISVPLSNPPIRSRHNDVNAWLCNELGQRRIIVYKDAPTVDEGLSLTKLKPGAQYLEDDSKSYQHVTTALGYGLCDMIADMESKPITQHRR